MNAISPVRASTALTSTLTLEHVGQRLAAIDRTLTVLDEEIPAGSVFTPKVRRLLEERDALHETALSTEPQTLADAAVVLMVVQYEIGIAVDPGPNVRWKCDPETRGENLAEALRRAAMVVCRKGGIAPQRIGGAYYLSDLLDNGAGA